MSCKQCNLLLQKVTVTFKSSSTQKDGSVTLTLKAGGRAGYDAGWTHHLHQVELPEGFQLDSVRADVAGLKHMGHSLIGKLLNHAKPAAVDLGMLVRHKGCTFCDEKSSWTCVHYADIGGARVVQNCSHSDVCTLDHHWFLIQNACNVRL